jgi:hypothetical protein
VTILKQCTLGFYHAPPSLIQENKITCSAPLTSTENSVFFRFFQDGRRVIKGHFVEPIANSSLLTLVFDNFIKRVTRSEFYKLIHICICKFLLMVNLYKNKSFYFILLP